MLPRRIEALELEQQQLYQQTADPAIYQGEGQKVVQVNKRLETLKQELANAYLRWEELEELQARYDNRASGGCNTIPGMKVR